jgi:zinc/manganese transport system substrate-binding protein
LLAAVSFLAHGSALAADRIGVVAAENFYGDLARQIGGNHVAVTSILSNPDEDPHLFETSPSTARAVADAKIVIYNGAGYDPWMKKLVSASSDGSRMAIVAAALTGRKDGDNPHLWYDPATLPAVAKALAAELARRDPANAAGYKANLAKFTTSMEKVGNEIAAVRNTYGGTEVTATEPVFGYMADALGLKMSNEDFQTAIMNETEPSAKDIAAVVDDIRGHKVKALVYNTQVTDAMTEQLLGAAREANVPVVGVTETVPEGMSYADWMIGQLESLEKALAGPSS